MKKLLVILLVLGMVAPVMAAEWNMYGSARVKFFYYDRDKEAAGVTDNLGVAEDDLDLDMGLQGNARVGANVKTSDEVSGRFEYGASGGNANIRLLYGTWNFGGGSLTVGQDYTPIDTLYSNQVIEDDNGLLYEGCTYEGRQAQLKLKMGGFQIALVKPSANGFGSIGVDTVSVDIDGDGINEEVVVATETEGDTDVVLPKLELAYDMKMDTVSVGGYFGYQTYTGGETGADFDVDSWLIGVRAKVNLGPAYINAVAHYGMNLGNYGVVMRNSYAGSMLVSGTNTEDATNYAAALIVGAKVNDMVALEAGVGYMKNEVDVPGSAVTREGDATTYYGQATITLAPGVFIVPEISIFDLGENDTGVAGSVPTDNGKVTTYGAKFQINF